MTPCSVKKNPPERESMARRCPEMASGDRLERLERLIEALEPAVLAEHTEHGLQGLSGLVGQYRAALAEVEDLRAKRGEQKGTPLDELASRRTGKTTGGRGRAAGGKV